ncbi:MAG: hypothetical protein R3D85_16570 [Paracoccaceae bacterium]
MNGSSCGIESSTAGPALGVEIVRGKGDPRSSAALPEPGEAPHPQVVYPSNAAIASPRLPALARPARSGPAPVLLCVGPSDLPAPQTGHAMTQRRVDLLAIEQNAWMLAARDPRCVVVKPGPSSTGR